MLLFCYSWGGTSFEGALARKAAANYYKVMNLRPLIAVSILFVGCGSSQRFGDARLVNPSNLFVSTLSRLELPEFDVSRRGRFEFTVEGAQKYFPNRLRFSHNSDLNIDTSRLIVDVTILDEDGKQILQKRLSNEDDQIIRRGNDAILKKITQLSQYTVIVTVVRPIRPIAGVEMRGRLASW